MPLLRTTERIFVGYSSPQLDHKETVERVIAGIEAAKRDKHVQLYVCEYRKLVIDTTFPQSGIDRMIENCDLVILLFGAHVGSGLHWEAKYSLELFRRGRVYRILPYVFMTDPQSAPATASPSVPVQNIERFYSDEGVIYYKIERPGDFESTLKRHIETWLSEEERIVDRQRDFMKRGLLRHFAIDDIAFQDDILAVHERDLPELAATSETLAAFKRYTEAPEDAEIQEQPLDYYLIARHLRYAVLNDKPEIVSSTEFINPIHQFLAALIRMDRPVVRDQIIVRYEQWLKSKGLIRERARSFAAFQLGMLQARQSATLLLETARNYGELKSIRHYAIYALGMLRQRSMIVPLMDMHGGENDSVLRDALTNSILFMMGVTE
ncbi:MAG: hypothetical protein IT367_16455 [Candidatus Hydrogenedentes bacterium]|nr:hypothetical protein [Candidatus Hydrogenedentota bacterium]